MPLSTTIAESFERSFALYRDLVTSLDEGVLRKKLPRLPSNTLGLQLWCVVGARESYSIAIQANEWSGFTCSLENAASKMDVAEALGRSEAAVIEVLRTIDDYSDVQDRLVVDLLEHEAAHHGQLIRYLYGLQLGIPDSWRSKYALK